MPLKTQEKDAFEKLLRLFHANSYKCKYKLIFNDNSIVTAHLTLIEKVIIALTLEDSNYEEY